MTPESPKGEPDPDDLALRIGRQACAALAVKGRESGANQEDIDAESFAADQLERLRSRLRTQRERLGAMRDKLMVVTRQAEMSMEPRRNEDFEIMDRLIAANLETVAALDSILKEEGT